MIKQQKFKKPIKAQKVQPMQKMKNSKGLFDIIIVMVILLIMGIIFVFGDLILINFRNNINGTMAEESYNITQAGINAYQVNDTMFGFLMIGAFMSVIVSGLYIRTHPIFFVVSIFLLTIIVMLSAIFTNLFDEFSSNSEMSTYAADFPYTTTLFHNLPVIVGIMGIVTLIIWYGKSHGDSGA